MTQNLKENYRPIALCSKAVVIYKFTSLPNE